MAINAIELGNIRHRAENCHATNADCLALLGLIDEGVDIDGFTEAISCAVESAIEGAISQSRIVDAVERAVRKVHVT